MHSAERKLAALVLWVLFSASLVEGDTLVAVARSHYAMGTMFDVLVYHASRDDAERAIQRAVDEVVRLDGVMSHYKADSDLSRLNRAARGGYVRVDSSLYDVIREANTFARLSGGKFDVTIAPVMKLWNKAAGDGRPPSADEIAEARRCIGYEKIELQPPDRIRFASECLEIDLGGIGKGYAVDRALAILESAGIQHALVNAGGSSIAAMGAPPGQAGWPVLVAPGRHERRVLLHGNSISTSEQKGGANTFGHIFDPHRGAPVENGMSVSVVAPRATVSDALSTTLLTLPLTEARSLLAHCPDVAALWVSPAGEVVATHRGAQIALAPSR
jgi:thiamine biosynthesis lipoprotein